MSFKISGEKLHWILVKAFWMVFLSFSVLHFYTIFKTAVDVPYMDEWALFEPHGIIMGWSRSFLFEFQNEHRFFVTRLLYLVNFELFGLNFRYQIIFNMVLFSGMVASIYCLLVRKNGLKDNLAALVCLGIFATTLPNEIHSFAILGNMAIVMSALLGGNYLLFCSKKWSSLVFGLALFWLAIYNFPGAIGAVIVIVFIYFIHGIVKSNRVERYRALIVLSGTALSIAAWFIGYQKNPEHPAYQMPWSLSFLNYFAELTSLGFGFTTVNPLISWFCLALVLLAVFVAVYQIFLLDQDRLLCLFSLVFCIGVLGMMACIALGRSGFGVAQAKSSRYAIVPMFLPVLSIVLFSFWIKWRKWAWLSISVLLIFGASQHLSVNIYYPIKTGRLQGRNCLKSMFLYPEQNPKGICRDIFIPRDLTDRLNRAKQLNISFTRKWKKP